MLILISRYFIKNVRNCFLSWATRNGLVRSKIDSLITNLLLLIDGGSKILVLDDFMSDRGIVDSPYTNTLAVEAETIPGGRVKDLDNVSIFEKFLKAPRRKKVAVGASSKEVDHPVVGFDLD